MCPNGNNKFGTFGQQVDFAPVKFKPIRAEFAKGSSPGSINRVNRESTWARWRRGYEIATATSYTNAFDYPFLYTIPVPSGTPAPGGNQPGIPGVFKGFPTNNKEFGMHWAGVRTAGSLRLDNIKDHNGTLASIASVTEDADYYYVQLTGDWSVTHPLPPPLYVKIPGSPVGLKAINGEILEDRVITAGGVPITRDTINPNTQKRYGYTQYILVETYPFTGILKLKKAGSVEATPDRSLITPASIPPNIGRFLITGTRYCCSCQDFNQREYAFMTNLDGKKNEYFPRSKVASIKPGRFEIMSLSGVVNNNAMTDGVTNRDMKIISPAPQYNLPPTITATSTTVPGTTRDFPGVYRDFGYIYVRSTANPALQGANAEGMPDYYDYTSSDNQITSISDYWTPLLDEKRYCKHIYAMRFAEGVFPPEPSDIPVEPDSIAEWEQDLVRDLEKQDRGKLYSDMKQSLGYMDVPPYNCQAPMMMPMMQKLFNIPAQFVKMQGFTMYDKNGQAYMPSQGEMPGT